MSKTADSAPFDVVGQRVLIGVQVVDISRLSTHPVPMTTQGLITVAGQGPKDSNGAGKSSFIAALSLLHADEQWRLASGASGAAELLFTAELAAQEGNWSNVDRGFVIGVFADRSAQTLEEIADSTLTVWLRINRKASHVDVRWCEGLHVPRGSTEAERAASVDALWNELPASNGRTDFHANRLASVLYGGHVRCVSFLSTSVRSSPTANLLAQPLNDLSPQRIFNAIATLTGLDRELEHEQALRSTEHSHRNNVDEAQRDLENWEQEMAVVEAGIARRHAAREVLGTARAAWQGRCARYLLDGNQRAEEIRGRLREIDGHVAELRETVDRLDDDIDALKDDGALDAKVRDADKRWRELDSADSSLRTEQGVATAKLEELRRMHERLTERARSADGRDLSTARAEEEQAKAEVEDALATRGAARAAADRSEQAVADANEGHDVATAQLRRLREAGIPAAAVLDVVDLEGHDRAEWEPRLTPYAGAVVVAKDQDKAAREALAELPGSLVVLADPPGRAANGDLPGVVGERFGLRTFFGALAERSGSESVVDTAANVVATGGFSEPITGQAARIAAAEERHRSSVEQLEQAERTLADARRNLELAQGRTSAAEAAEQAADTQAQITQLRTENEKREAQREELAPELEQAQAQRTKCLAEREVKSERIERLVSSKNAHERTSRQQEEEKNQLTEERDQLNLVDRERAWGDSPAAAETYLLSLDAEEQQRGTAQWNEEACHHLNDVAHRCFPENTPTDEMPSELHSLLIEQRWRRGGLDTRVALVPDLLRALQTHLRQTEEHDRYQYEQIVSQREQRTNDLAAARQGLAEAEQTSQAHRTSLAQGIKAKLKQVSDEFHRLDQHYGGYGAGLDYPEPEPPAEPDKPWRWAVTPKWRRAEGQRMSSYTLRSNTAQMDEKAVKLVCAAALAGGGDRPLLLVLDELGRNLGKQHRREAVALFEQIGLDRNITVIGALQDDMERYAIEASGLYIKLRRSSDTMPYNEAPVIVGDDANRSRVELLREWLGSYHPESAEV
jgi:chromosome segregation protein